MATSKRLFGDLGEKLAADFIADKGYRVIDTNFRRPFGEIDLIAKKGKVVIFFEVKTRKSAISDIFPGELSVNRPKQRRIIKTCRSYLAEKRFPPYQEWQIDVLSIAIDKEAETARIKHIENAVSDFR